MFSAHIAEAIDRAGASALAAVSQEIWKALAAGVVSEDEAQSLAERLQARKETLHRLRLEPRPKAAPRRVKRPERIHHRRKLAASAPLPPQLAAHFTIAELSVLRIVSDECRGRGVCDRSLAEIAARAGTSKTTARNALRTAARLGLITTQERRRRGQASLTNVVTIVSAEWRTWQSRGPSSARGEGAKIRMPMDTQVKGGGVRVRSPQSAPGQKGYDGGSNRIPQYGFR
jgi:hypothetical protein